MEKVEESFEAKVEKIDEILKCINDENTNLQDSVELYKRGIILIKEAREILQRAKVTIKEIQDTQEGEQDG